MTLFSPFPLEDDHGLGLPLLGAVHLSTKRDRQSRAISGHFSLVSYLSEEKPGAKLILRCVLRTPSIRMTINMRAINGVPSCREMRDWPAQPAWVAI